MKFLVFYQNPSTWNLFSTIS